MRCSRSKTASTLCSRQRCCAPPTAACCARAATCGCGSARRGLKAEQGLHTLHQTTSEDGIHWDEAVRPAAGACLCSDRHQDRRYVSHVVHGRRPAALGDSPRGERRRHSVARDGEARSANRSGLGERAAVLPNGAEGRRRLPDVVRQLLVGAQKHNRVGPSGEPGRAKHGTKVRTTPS